MTELTTADDVYKHFIDDLVWRAKEMGGGARLAELGDVVLESKEDEKTFCEWLAQMSPSQRDLIVRVLQKERHGGVHDTLVALRDLVERDGIALTFNGEPLRAFVGDFHYDYVGRFQGDWEWPKNR